MTVLSNNVSMNMFYNIWVKTSCRLHWKHRGHTVAHSLCKNSDQYDELMMKMFKLLILTEYIWSIVCTTATPGGQRGELRELHVVGFTSPTLIGRFRRRRNTASGFVTRSMWLLQNTSFYSKHTPHRRTEQDLSLSQGIIEVKLLFIPGFNVWRWLWSVVASLLCVPSVLTNL